MATTLFFSFLGSLVICMALIPPLMASAGRLHILDLPGGRRMHSGAVAKVGGIALAIGTFIGVLMWEPKNEVVLASLIGGVVILIFGVWDDRAGLSYRAKFAGQALAVLIVMVVGGVQLSSLPLASEEWVHPWVTLPLTFLILMAVTNAVNLADGLDGLAGGLSLISFAGFAYLAFQTEDAIVLLMVVSVLGGLLGFLRFNTYPARIFMGDAGSQFLGFYLGVTGVVLIDQAHGPYSPILALFVWGLPLLDTLAVMIQRWLEGRSLFMGDRNHLHHKLLNRGWSHREAVMMIYGIQTAMVALGYGLRWQSDWLLIAVYSAVAAGVLALFFQPAGGRADLAVRQERQPATQLSSWLLHRPTLAWLPVQILAIAVSGFLLMSIGLPHTIPFDAGLVAAVLLVMLLLGMAMRRRWLPWLVRAGLYFGSTFILYALEVATPSAPGSWFQPVNLFLVGIAALVIVVMRLHAVRQFQTTPLDSLMVLLGLVLPFLPEIHIGEINLSVLTARLIVLFFSFELLLQAYSDRMGAASVVAIGLLGGLGIRALW
jgi:UDP-GlcNAc:undecaprenyl-phosphate/decaprenyl-phosphate GlcNAc-1-phosphate transferase